MRASIKEATKLKRKTPPQPLPLEAITKHLKKRKERMDRAEKMAGKQGIAWEKIKEVDEELIKVDSWLKHPERVPEEVIRMVIEDLPDWKREAMRMNATRGQGLGSKRDLIISGLEEWKERLEKERKKLEKEFVEK